MYLIIANPKAGGGLYQRIKKKIEHTLDHQGVRYKIVSVQDLNDIPQIINEHRDKKLTGIVALGGNATVNAVLNSMPRTKLPFGIIPISKTNTFAEIVNINSWQQALKLLVAKPQITALTLGQIGERFFVNKIEILPKKNLITNLVATNNWLDRLVHWLGIEKQFKTTAVNTTVICDRHLGLRGLIKQIEVKIDENSKDSKRKLVLDITATDEDGKSLPSYNSRLRAKEVEINADLSLLVMAGNETIANTPVTIQALQRTIPLIIPKLK